MKSLLKCGQISTSEINRNKHAAKCAEQIIYSVIQPRNDPSCQKCDVQFCSKESLELHVTNCERSKLNGNNYVKEKHETTQMFVVKPREVPQKVIIQTFRQKWHFLELIK